MKARSPSSRGDGIGPEVVAEGVRVLEQVGAALRPRIHARRSAVRRHRHRSQPAIRCRSTTLDCMPRGGRRAARRHRRPEVGRHPRQVRPEQGLLRLRKRARRVRATCGRSSCTRRCATPRRSSRRCSTASDLVFVRELTGGIYFGEKTRTADAAPRDLCSYSVAGDRAHHARRRPARHAAPQEDRLDRQVQRARDLAPVARSRRRA